MYFFLFHHCMKKIEIIIKHKDFRWHRAELELSFQLLSDIRNFVSWLLFLESSQAALCKLQLIIRL